MEKDGKRREEQHESVNQMYGRFTPCALRMVTVNDSGFASESSNSIRRVQERLCFRTTHSSLPRVSDWYQE
jgi:hypothetical protein